MFSPGALDTEMVEGFEQTVSPHARHTQRPGLIGAYFGIGDTDRRVINSIACPTSRSRAVPNRWLFNRYHRTATVRHVYVLKLI